MKANLAGVLDALAGLTDTELQALIIVVSEAPRITDGFVVWIRDACDWELNRRIGRNYDLVPPEADANPSEDAASIDTIHAMRASFAATDLAPAALKFFNALAELLAGGARKR